VVVDMNGNGLYGDVISDRLREHVVRDMVLDMAPGTTEWAVATDIPFVTPSYPALGPTWVRATLSRQPVAVEEWNGGGVFCHGETEDFHGLAPTVPPAPVVGAINVAAVVSVNGGETIVAPVLPDYRAFPVWVWFDQHPIPRSVQVVLTTARIVGAPGPNIIRDPLDSLGFLRRPVVAPDGVGVRRGLGNSVSLARPGSIPGSIPRDYWFITGWPRGGQFRRWRVQAALAAVAPGGLPVNVVNLKQPVPGGPGALAKIQTGPGCGDGVLGGGESCDPPGAGGGCPAGEVCNATCSACAAVGPPACGNSLVEAGEVCDPPLGPGACGAGTTCSAFCDACTTCTNGVLDGGEVCDKTATPTGCALGQFCGNDCEGCYPVELCGNGLVDGGEACDASAEIPGCALGTTCGETCATCEPVGACCLEGGFCAEQRTPTDCAEYGGTFGGAASSCASAICLAPPPVPDGTFGTPLRISRANAAGTILNVSWDATHCGSVDYHLLYGQLANVGSYVIDGSVCDLGPGGTATGLPVPSGSLFFLMVADDGGGTEGSWGHATGGPRNGTTPSGVCGITARVNDGFCL
jgi:hypothetical protein